MNLVSGIIKVLRTIGVSSMFAVFCIAMVTVSISAAVAPPDVALNRQWAETVFSSESVKLTPNQQGDLNPGLAGKEGVSLPGIPFSFVYGGKHSSAFIRDWKSSVVDKSIDGDKKMRILTITDPNTGLEVRAEAIIYLNTAGVDWTLYFTNKGDKNTPVIEDIKAIDTSVFSSNGTPILHRLHGVSVDRLDDFLPFDQPVISGDCIDFACAVGRTTLWSYPIFNVEWNGGGVITALGWSGQWKARVENSRDRVLHIQMGMEKTHFQLCPGETIRSPRILQLYWSGKDIWRSYNMFRRTMLSNIMPKINGSNVIPPMSYATTAFNEWDKATEKDILSHLKSMEGLGFEYLWLDAFWLKGSVGGVGNYGIPLTIAEPIDRHPSGLGLIGRETHKAGQKFILWFEPERVAPGTHIAKEYPGYVISPGKDGSGLFDLGNPKAREYMTTYLKTAIKEYGVDCLRIDFNMNPLPFWEHVNALDPNRIGICEIRYMEGLYQMWDDIRKTYPNLFIDNCASGGTRIDIETCSRSIPLWRTDATTGYGFIGKEFNKVAISDQVMSAGLNRYIPVNTGGAMDVSLYGFRSACNGGVVVLGDLRVEGYPLEKLKQAIAEGKRLRNYYWGNYYALSPVTLDPSDWCVVQYHNPDSQNGMVIGFRRDASLTKSFPCRLREIDSQSKYLVKEYASYSLSKKYKLKGEDLQQLVLEIKECPSSLLIEYEKVAR